MAVTQSWEKEGWMVGADLDRSERRIKVTTLRSAKPAS